MTINIEKETEFEFEFGDCESVIRNAVEKTATYMKFPYEAEVNVVVTNAEEIHQINKEYREIDRPTDVLSFPMIEYDTPGNFSVIDEDILDFFNPETGEVLLGDIVLSCDAIVSQAKEYGHSQLREMSFLVVHSMLHLFGYDHMDESDKTMENLQREILMWMDIKR